MILNFLLFLLLLLFCCSYAVSSKDLIPEDIKVFDTFTTHIAKIITARPGMQLVDILQIQLSLLNFALKCYPGNLAYIDQVLHHMSALKEIVSISC